MQIAKIRGARVTAICGKRNSDMVLSLGADSVVCYDAGNDEDDVITSLRDITSQFGLFDVVFDSVSSDDPRDDAHEYEKRIRGRCGNRRTSRKTNGIMQPHGEGSHTRSEACANPGRYPA